MISPRHGSLGSLVSFFESLETDADTQRETGAVPEASEERRAKVQKIRQSFSLPGPPIAPLQTEPALCEVSETLATTPKSLKGIAKTAYCCKKCSHVFALKKTLDMHEKHCQTPP
jgi:hypothetical protein